MGFKINEISETSHSVEVDEPLWLAADRETVVAEGDPEAAFLLATPGKRLSREDAIRYNLVKPTKEEKARAEAEAKATEAAAELAAEEGVDLAEVEGSGAEGRITKADVQAELKDDQPQADKQAAPSGRKRK